LTQRDATPVDATPVDALSALEPTVANMALLVAQLQAAQAGNKVRAPSANKSAKAYIRELLSVDGALMSVDELCKASGKTAVNIRTALSDLRSESYCGNAGTFKTVAVKRDNVTRYERAKPAA